MECGHIQGLPQFFEYPILSQERVKLRTSNLAGSLYSEGPCEQKPIKILGENGGWAQERVKLRNSNFVRTFLVSIGTKVHYKFLEK